MPIIKTKMDGFTLLEVLVAVLVLAIGLLGLAQLQITSLKENQTAYYRSQATSFASDIFDRMRANQKEVSTGLYNIALSGSASTAAPTISQKDLNDWLNQLDAMLPNGDGSIACTDFDTSDSDTCSSGSIHKIEVTWTESDQTGSKVSNSFVYEGVL